MVGGQVAKDLDDSTRMDGDVFDKIDDLLEFSDELRALMEPEIFSFDDVLGLGTVGAAAASPSAVAVKRKGGAFPCDDVPDLEWLSSFGEESLQPTTVQLPKCEDDDDDDEEEEEEEEEDDSNNSAVEDGGGEVDLRYRTRSPVSVLEHNGPTRGGGSGGATGGSFSSSLSSSSPTTSSCCSSTMVKPLAPPSKPADLVPVRGARPRTKRTRPPSGPRSNVLMPIVCSAMDGTGGDSSPFAVPPTTNSASESETLQDFNISSNLKRKKLMPNMVSSYNSEVPGIRKCSHCEIQKTPQWRAGPMGPKTLCNACGVRYKTGRLFPEYRPAASPTFVSSLHSNSHKKVVEMRFRAPKTDSPAVASSLPASAKGCELLNYIRSS